MTTASMSGESLRCEPARPRGIERLAVEFGLAMVAWGRARTERADASRGRRAALLREHAAAEAREHAARRYGIAG